MIEDTLQSILDQMHDILHRATGPRNRREYMRANGIGGGVNWSFSLTADDIIRDRIPAQVIGCTGVAKLFCHLAHARGVRCYVVAMAHLPDWRREYMAAHGKVPDSARVTISGHQIIAVDTPAGMRMFDPVRRGLQFLDAAPRVGAIVDMFDREYMVKAIVPGDEFMSVSSYWDLDRLYRD